ncbi:calcineurin-like phosphoesterase protein [Rutstroemia sp. NJR-2017a WRK4]|nr:calcineurin-like phosphoesterase protein [Rutstroemia sp. NJR-2017a WRK4]
MAIIKGYLYEYQRYPSPPTKLPPPPPPSVQVKMRPFLNLPFFSSSSSSFSPYLLLFYLAFLFIALRIFGVVSDLQYLLQSFTLSSRQPTHSILGNDVKLRVDQNYEFLITIFSDLHYGEEEDGWGIDQDVNSTKVIRDILEWENSNLVVLNENSTAYLDTVVAPLVKNNIYWASTYGNHDSQFNLSREALFLEESKYQLSYTQHSPPGVDGVRNYYLPIYPPIDSESPDDPLAILWFFDSQGGAPFQASSDSETIPNYVTPSIVDWFTSTSSQLTEKYGRSLPSLAFVHIPPIAFLEKQEEAFVDPDVYLPRYPGLNADVPLAAQGDGTQDKLFMEALVGIEGLHSVYSGHDHGDAWCADFPKAGVVKGREDGNGPFLCFCKHSGYGGYGTWNRGARVLRLWFGMEGEEEMQVDTWVRMEDGDVIQMVGLNTTYGTDIYPPLDGE